jgi:hypothetical protein
MRCSDRAAENQEPKNEEDANGHDVTLKMEVDFPPPISVSA